MLLHVDNTKFKVKPTGQEIGGIKARFGKSASIKDITVKQLANCLTAGQTVQPGVTPFSENSRKAGKKGTCKEDFTRQTVFMNDIDNKRSDIPLETPEHIKEVLAANNLKAAFMYETFNSTATKYAQARLLFDEAHNMIKQSPALSKHFRKRKNDLYYENTMSKFQPLARNSDTLDGLNASFVIMDELHGVKDRNMYEVMRQSMATRRQPLLIMITTAGTVRECIFDEMYGYAASVADGVIADPHFLPVMYELDDSSEWTDPNVWIKANPALGTVKKTDDLTQKVERAKQNRSELSGVLCKEFNVRETVKTAWLSFDDINNENTFELEAFRGAYCIGGVDLSVTTDLTCASLLFMKRGDDCKYITQMYWIPAARLLERIQQDKIPYDKWHERGLLRLCDGNSINYSDVTAWFCEIVKKYDLFPAWIYYDSYSARYFVEEMQMQGFNMVRCIQGAKTLSLPMQMLGADLQAHKVIYNNNPVLKWCLTNTGVQTDRNGNIVPIKNQSPKQRIDGTAALLDCYVGLYEHFTEYTNAI